MSFVRPHPGTVDSKTRGDLPYKKLLCCYTLLASKLWSGIAYGAKTFSMVQKNWYAKNMCGWTFIARHQPKASGYQKKLLTRRNMKKKYMISWGSKSWVGRIRWQWKYGRHCAIDILLSFSIPARLLFPLCSPLAPLSAHLNAWNRLVLTMKILHWVITDDKRRLQITLYGDCLLMSKTKTNRRTDREQYTRSNTATARLLTLVKPAET